MHSRRREEERKQRAEILVVCKGPIRKAFASGKDTIPESRTITQATDLDTFVKGARTETQSHDVKLKMRRAAL